MLMWLGMNFEQKLVAPVGLANLLAWHALMHAAWTPPTEEDDDQDYMFESLEEVESTLGHLDRAEAAIVLSYLLEYGAALAAQLEARPATTGRRVNPVRTFSGSRAAGADPAPLEADALRAVFASLPASHPAIMPSLIYTTFQTLVGMCTEFAALDGGSFTCAEEVIESVEATHSEPVVVRPRMEYKPSVAEVLDDPPF